MQSTISTSVDTKPHDHMNECIKRIWQSTKEKSKQNITRDIEIKNIVTIARGEWEGDSGERGL